MQLTDKYKPSTLADFIGIPRVKTVLSSFARNPYPSAWLFLGPSGLGKTTMALALAREISAEVHHVPSRSCNMETVDKICHDCHYVSLLNKWHAVIVDEADQMSHAAQLAFLSRLDGTAAPPDTIFLFTANETAQLKDRFLSRCRTVRFDTTGLLEPAAEFLRKVWDAEDPTTPAPDFRAIVKDANCNIRQALMDLELELIAPRPQFHRPKDCHVLAIDTYTERPSDWSTWGPGRKAGWTRRQNLARSATA